MLEDRDVLEREIEQMRPRPIGLDDLIRRRERKNRNRRITSGAVGIAIFVVAVWIVATAARSGPVRTPATTGPTVAQGSDPDYVLDLNTGATTPLPESIDGWRYAVSPDGSMLAYVGSGDDGSPQIFLANIDGTGVRQMTRMESANWPAWSPDGTVIAYEGFGPGTAIFMLDVATGESTQITDGTSFAQFTLAGRSLHPDETSVLRTVPVPGGKGTLLIGFRGALAAFMGLVSLSPDGSLVTFVGSLTKNGPGAVWGVANADGTERRALPGCIVQGPWQGAGIWSPDGSRIVCPGSTNGIVVVDIATGEASRVAEGTGAIWLGRDTLLVDA
jgi:WD40 repeat protein